MDGARQPVQAAQSVRTEPVRAGADMLDLVELLFFAYRDFTAEADAALAGLGLGRAHHRVLHFVHWMPGQRVADLLDVLKITKQSLARVLKELIESGLVEQREGPSDRRERLLFSTLKGGALAAELAALQSRRMEMALTAAGVAEGADAVRSFLEALIADPGRARAVAAARHDRRKADAEV